MVKSVETEIYNELSHSTTLKIENLKGVWGCCVTSLKVRSVETELVFTNICCNPGSNEGLDY